MPHLKKVSEKYLNDSDVAFLLVSLDDDEKRLARYLDDMKFQIPVARAPQKLAEDNFKVFDIPATFYVDRAGIVRYEARGLEVHGESEERVQWFIEELKKQKPDTGKPE